MATADTTIPRHKHTSNNTLSLLLFLLIHVFSRLPLPPAFRHPNDRLVDSLAYRFPTATTHIIGRAVWLFAIRSTNATIIVIVVVFWLNRIVCEIATGSSTPIELHSNNNNQPTKQTNTKNMVCASRKTG